MREVSVFLHTFGISIALAIRSLDLALGLWCRVAWCCYTPVAPLALSKAGAQCAPYKNGGRGISIALTIRSLDPTLQMYKVELKFKCSNG